MGLFDMFKRQEPVVETPQSKFMTPEEYLQTKLSDPSRGISNPYEKDLHIRLCSLRPCKWSEYLPQLTKIDEVRAERGMRPLDAKEASLAIKWAEKGLNMGSFALEPDYASMSARVEQCAWQVGEGQYQEHDYNPPSLDNIEVHIKDSHAEELTPQMRSQAFGEER